MREYLPILRECALFQNIEDENLLPMMGCLGATVHTYKKHEHIFSEGDAATKLGIVLSGEVQVVGNDYEGNRSLVANMEKAELFAENFACAEVDALPVDVVASEDSRVILMDVHRVTRSCGNACAFHSQIIFNLMKIVAQKNLVYHRKIEITSKRSTREKLMTYLSYEARKHGKASFSIPYDRQELADYLEVERSGLSAEISKMRKEGILEAEKNRFTLKDWRRIGL